MTEKPPYKIPSVSEIYSVPLNGLRAVSTFSGCGGTCLGMRWAGVKVLWANEFIPAAQETYRANHKDTFLNTADIRTVTGAQIREESGLGNDDLDIFEGSPPCAAFSTSGKREAGWGKVRKYSDTKQRVDDLFFEHIRILRELRPKAFFAENVKGLITGTAKGYFKSIISAMTESGYRVRASIIDASWLGVPQKRKRLFFIGIREDIGLIPEFPKPFGYFYSVQDAINAGGIDIQSIPDNEAKHITHITAHAKTTKIGSWNYNFNVPCMSEPSPVLLATTADKCVTHPSGVRKFTLKELKRLSGFPDDFILTGSYTQQWERIGRSVPPPLGRAVAEALSRQLIAAAVK